MQTKRRLLTGDRPTGKMHIGHYVGSLVHRVKLQDKYECFFIIADLHMLTTKYTNLEETAKNINDMVLDYLSVGIDPQKSTIYLQSLVPEVAELSLIFSMLISVPRLERVPTLKDVMRNLKLEAASLGLLTYPVLQTADILMVRAELVPVGQDNEPHLEVAREIARRFNSLYGNLFPEPTNLPGHEITLVGTDGQRKMSKSLGNCIYLSDDESVVREKIRTMYTDPARIHKYDKGHPDNCPVFSYHKVFGTSSEQLEEIRQFCLAGKIGCVECKKILMATMQNFLVPIRQRRASYERQKGLIQDILIEGSRKARAEAIETLELVKKAMGLDYFRKESLT